MEHSLFGERRLRRLAEPRVVSRFRVVGPPAGRHANYGRVRYCATRWRTIVRGRSYLDSAMAARLFEDVSAAGRLSTAQRAGARYHFGMHPPTRRPYTFADISLGMIGGTRPVVDHVRRLVYRGAFTDSRPMRSPSDNPRP
jgi:hypothetical protein